MSVVGRRFCVSGHTGTVRYSGPVSGTSGEWLGVEWDDPWRGKHDGVKDGQRYFTCVVPNSGSFIRNTSSIEWGRTFLEALRSKYIEDAFAGADGEYVTLGSSNGVIEVEAVGLDKIRRNLAQLERLRAVSLDNEHVSSRGPPGEIQASCPNIRQLDLSKTLIASWDVVATIALELRVLESFSFNHNRFSLPENISLWPGAFNNLQDIQLNWTMLDIEDLLVITSASFMPRLSSAEFGYNRLGILHVGSPDKTISRTALDPPAFAALNLDSNELCSWLDIVSAIKSCRKLRKLFLTSNKLETIPTYASSDDLAKSWMSSLKHVSLVDNPLKSWPSIDALASWCSSLEGLSLSGTPLADDKYARQLVIAKLPSLRTLDASRITEKERTDCELFYLSQISREESLTTDESRQKAHPQWNVLCAKHGRPEAVQVQKNENKLSNRLIEIHLIVSSSPTPTANISPTDSSRVTLRVLPTMSIRTFGMKAAKSLKLPPCRSRKPTLRFWTQMSSFHNANSDTRWVELDTANDSRDLSWWGLDDGSMLVVYVDE